MVIKIKYAFFFLIFFCYSCKEKVKDSADNLIINKDTLTVINTDSKAEIKNTADKTKFNIETSINKISLLDSESLLRVITSPIFLENMESEFPELIIFNKDKTQKLTLLFYPGSEKNNVSYFILEKSNKELKGDNVFDLEIENFKTNNDVTLGVESEFIKNKYLSNEIKLNIEGNKDGSKILSYFIDDFEHPFLKEYNMTIYSAKYYLANDKLIKIEFGFEYP